MKRRIARKILKRIRHKVQLIGNAIFYLYQPSSYKPSTVHRAEAVLGLFALEPNDLCHEWGLFDPLTETWFGTGDSPYIYDDERTAMAMRQIVAARIPCSPLLISVEPFTSATRKLDEITFGNTLDQAMALIEQRGF
jgi:hypothetical protein